MENNNNQNSFFLGIDFLGIQKRMSDHLQEIKNLEEKVKKEEDLFFEKLNEHVTSALTEKNQKFLTLIFSDQIKKNMRKYISSLAPVPESEELTVSSVIWIASSSLNEAGFETIEDIKNGIEEINKILENFIIFKLEEITILDSCSFKWIFCFKKIEKPFK